MELKKTNNVNVIIRKVAILIILLFLALPVTPWVGQIARSFYYNVSRRVAQIYLNYRTRDYNALEGNSFVVKYSAADEAIAQQTIQLTEHYLQEIQELLDFTLPRERKFLVVIYPDKESLNSSFGWDKSQNPIGVYWAGGISFLSPHSWEAEPGQDDLKEIFRKENPLAHEITHLMVDYLSKGNYPRWLSEGLAQYTEKKLTNYTLPLPEENSGFLAIEQLENQFDNPEMQLQAYWQAREMVDYLVGEYGWEKIVQYLVFLGDNNSSRAFRYVYGFSTKDLLLAVFDN